MSGYDVAFIAVQGSQNYNLDIYTDEYKSDVDTKAAIVPDLKDIVTGQPPLSTTVVLDNDEHIDVKDIRQMFHVIEKENISYVELLYSKYIFVNKKYYKILMPMFKNRDLIVKNNIEQFVKTIFGMMKEKQKALCHPYPATAAKIEKYGYDGKQLCHCQRLLYFLEDIYYNLHFDLDFHAFYRCEGKYRHQKLMDAKLYRGNRHINAQQACDDIVNLGSKLRELILDDLKGHQNGELLFNPTLEDVKYNVFKKKFKIKERRGRS